MCHTPESVTNGGVKVGFLGIVCCERRAIPYIDGFWGEFEGEGVSPGGREGEKSPSPRTPPRKLGNDLRESLTRSDAFTWSFVNRVRLYQRYGGAKSKIRIILY